MKLAVFDANVVASGVAGREQLRSTPGLRLERWERREFDLATSAHILAEVERTLRKRYFVDRVDPDIAERTLEALRRKATLVDAVVLEWGIASHPEDDVVLVTAVEAGAGYLVTGDRQLLKLGSYRGVAIVNPRDFLALLDAADAERREVSDGPE